MSNSKVEIQRRINKAKTKQRLDAETPEQRAARLERSRLLAIKRQQSFATNETKKEYRERILLKYGKSVEYVVRKKPNLNYNRLKKKEAKKKNENGIRRPVKMKTVKTNPIVVAAGGEFFEIREIKLVPVNDYDQEEINFDPLDVVDIMIKNE